jgi:hypothetical protein
MSLAAVICTILALGKIIACIGITHIVAGIAMAVAIKFIDYRTSLGSAP